MATDNKHLSSSEILSEMDGALSHSGMPKNRLNHLLKAVEERIRCDSECQRKKDIAALKKKWKNSKEQYNDLPEQIDRYEKKFYVLDKGEEYYRNNILRQRFDEHIKKWNNDQQAKFNEVKSLMRTLLDNYTSETLSKSRLNQLYQDVSDKNKALRRDINDYYKNAFTNQRKIYYENEEIDSLEYYRTIIKVLYYTVLGIYVLFGSFFKNSDYKNWKVWVGIALYIGFPFILRYLINMVLYVYDGYF